MDNATLHRMSATKARIYFEVDLLEDVPIIDWIEGAKMARDCIREAWLLL